MMNYLQIIARVMLCMILATTNMNDMNAQTVPDIMWGRTDYARRDADQLEERTKALLAARKDKMKKLSNTDLMEEPSYWWDGETVYSLGYEDNDKTRVLVPLREENVKSYAFTSRKTKRGTTLIVKGKVGWRVSMESLGPWTLLLFHDAKGNLVDCFIKTHPNDFRDCVNLQTISMHDLYDGVYETATGEKAVFGPVLKHYKDLKYEIDPGLFYCEVEEQSRKATGIIRFGEGRVSHGDPSSPKYGNMPGGGGAGAIMGPMEWAIHPIEGGLHVKIVQDQPFVDHKPDFPTDEFDLKKVQGPYADLPGLYAVASVRPLPKGLLHRLAKKDLRQMQKDIQAQHANGSKLTDIERINSSLIKAVMSKQ